MNRDLNRRVQSSSERSPPCKFSVSYNNYLRLSVPTCTGFGGPPCSPVVLGALRGRRLTVTAIGRALPGGTSQKHGIKRADRLVSNRHLHAQRVKPYRGLCRSLVGATTRPVILVDWSDLDARKRHYLLRASLARDGRSVTVYEEVHTLASKDKRRNAPGVSATVAGAAAGRLPPDYRDRCGLSHALVSARGGVGLGIGSDGYATAIRCVGAAVDAGLMRNAVINRRPARPRYLGQAVLTRSNPWACQLVVYRG